MCAVVWERGLTYLVVHYEGYEWLVRLCAKTGSAAWVRMQGDRLRHSYNTEREAWFVPTAEVRKEGRVCVRYLGEPKSRCR